MKVKELIEQLKQQDPEKEVLIQQGEEFDYMIAHSVRENDFVDMTVCEEDEAFTGVVIGYI